jgi:hypothetical protein
MPGQITYFESNAVCTSPLSPPGFSVTVSDKLLDKDSVPEAIGISLVEAVGCGFILAVSGGGIDRQEVECSER